MEASLLCIHEVWLMFCPLSKINMKFCSYNGVFDYEHLIAMQRIFVTNAIVIFLLR